MHFNHGLAQIVTAVMAAGLILTAIEEHDTVPWNPMGDAMGDAGGGEYRLREGVGTIRPNPASGKGALSHMVRLLPPNMAKWRLLTRAW